MGGIASVSNTVGYTSLTTEDDKAREWIVSKVSTMHKTPALDQWEQDMFIREAMIQHDLNLVDTRSLPNATIVATLLVDASLFMFFCAVMWSKPQLAVFYTPSQICSGVTLLMLYPIKLMSWWPVRNLITLVFCCINFVSVAYCMLPFMDDCYRFWAYIAADHSLCQPACFENTTPMVEYISFFFACNSVFVAMFVLACTIKVRACDKYF